MTLTWSGAKERNHPMSTTIRRLLPARWRAWLDTRSHRCDQPRGVIFDPYWTCPVCNTKWHYLGYANFTAWERVDG